MKARKIVAGRKRKAKKRCKESSLYSAKKKEKEKSRIFVPLDRLKFLDYSLLNMISKKILHISSVIKPNIDEMK